MREVWRKRAARALGAYFERRRWPRLSLSFVMLGTGAAGFGFSYALLKLGMTRMWLRYPLAVLGAYVVFLLLVRVWVEIERMHFNPEDPEVLEILGEGAQTAEEEPYSFDEKKRSWLDWLDVPDFGGVDSLEGCGVAILVMAVVGVLAILVTTVIGAPLLLGEVAVDVLLISLLYRRLRAAEREHWLSAAVRQTWISMLATAALLAIIGLCLQGSVPDAATLGEVIRHWRGL